MDAKFTGPGTDMTVEFGESKAGLPTEKITTAPARTQAQKYNPRDGMLPAAHWSSNKGTERHWHQGVMAHLRIDDGHEVTEAEYDDALAAVKAIRLG